MAANRFGKKSKPPQTPGAKPRPVKPVKKKRRHGRIAFAVLVGLATAAVIFFIWARSQGELSVTENAVGSLMSPVENAVTAVADWARDWVQDIKDRNQLRSDYESSQLTIETLQYRIAQLEEASTENERLLALLDAKERYEAMDPVYARVIAREPGAWFDVFSINCGTLSGVDINMAVITGDGLVGHVFEVGLNYAKVRTIIDSRSAVAGLIERTRDNGVMRGQLAGTSADADLYMYYLPSVNDIIPGDRVFTSGVDELFPKGIPVGTVRAVSRQTDVSDQYIIVTPLADFQRLEEVLVLRTVVETDDEGALPRLPDATPRPVPTTSALPSGSPDPLATPTPAASGEVWNRPTPTPDPSAEPSPTPEPTGGIAEDQWAEGD